MKAELDKVAQAMREGDEPIEDIRQSARSIFDIASCNYTDYLLKSALNMIGAIIQFANDLETPPE